MSGVPPKRLRRPILLAGAWLPPLAFLWLILAQNIPASVLAETVSLAGEWKVVSGLGADDANAPALHLPGGYYEQGFRGRSAWLTRRFVVPARWDGEPLFLTLGDTRSGVVEVFVNDQSSGELRAHRSESRTDLTGPRGFDIPERLLHPGENRLTLHFEWFFEGQDGVRHPQLLIGPARTLKAFHEEVAEARRVLQNGAAFLMLFLIVLFGALLSADWTTANRRLYLSCLGLLVAALAYLVVMTGVFVQVPIESAYQVPAVYLSILGLAYAQPEFVSRYFIGERSKFRRFNRYACGVFLFALLTTFALHKPRWATAVFIAIALYTLVPVTFLTWQAYRRVRASQGDLDRFLFAGTFCSAATGGLDLLGDAGLLSIARVYPMGVSACAIMAGVVLIADFTKVAFDNRALSHSLKKTNEELADALVKAQESVRLKTEFVATVSHELRTPLLSLINIPEEMLGSFPLVAGAKCQACGRTRVVPPGRPDVLAAPCPGCGFGEKSVAQQVRTFAGDADHSTTQLEQIRLSGARLLSLVEDVLDFSKADSGKVSLHLEDLDVEDAVRSALDTVAPIAAQRRIPIERTVPKEGPKLRADPVKLNQILVNLVGNALKFSAEGTIVHVTVELHGDTWLFSVQDDGIGIAAEHHAAIFESFRQVDGSVTRAFGGAGLGLAITRRLVEAHRGRIWVDSERGRGSIFWVELPVAGPPSAAPDDLAALGEDEGPRVILIVDDEPVAVESLRAALRPLKHEVHAITDPRELEKALEVHRPDLLILDLMMPEISGLDILRALKARGAQMPVLVSSAYHGNVDVVRALGAAWLGKPWRSADLRTEVKRLLREADRATRRQALPAPGAARPPPA